ncbi:hypothetical protein FPV67DRAFT_1486682 [Lyophyllum atratum]|nr:hypothetical protein FPV67DRAFT_1486682 [Lyophyllum atratum]
MSQRSARSGLSLFGMIGVVMTALKLKQHWDEYKPLSSQEEGRVALSSTTPITATAPYSDGDEASIGLLDPETRPKRKRASGCCVCCGINFTLFWKAFGIVAAGLLIWNAIKLILWAVTDAPTGLDLMPAFSSSLGCLAASHLYNGSKVVMTARMGDENDHSFDMRGSAVGTFIITRGDADLKDVKYEMTSSHVCTSHPQKTPCCVAQHNADQFDSAADVELDSLYVTMFAMDKNTLVLPSQGVRGNHMTLEAYRGWIVGDVAIVNSTSITTQRADGIVNVRAHPTVPLNPELPDPAYLRTTTGAGRTDVFYIGSKAFKRPIHNVHMSSRNADMYFTYREAEYNGRIELDSTSFTATGLQRFAEVPSKEEGDGSPRWTHWAGNKEGGDQIYCEVEGLDRFIFLTFK